MKTSVLFDATQKTKFFEEELERKEKEEEEKKKLRMKEKIILKNLGDGKAKIEKVNLKLKK